MPKTNIGELSFDVGLNVDWRTADLCLRLIEVYLDNNPEEELHIVDNTAGEWYLELGDRKDAEPYKGGGVDERLNQQTGID